jgi:hypothetical protein
MSTFIKLLALGALVAAVGAGIALASIGGGSDTSSPTLSPVASTPGTTTGMTGTTGDVSGPCDEAEHRNDPRCANGADGRRHRGNDDRRGRDREPGEDVRGPCDELEHANDPRCTGAGGGEDNSGPGSSHSGSGGGGHDDD